MMPASNTKNYDYSIINRFLEIAASHPDKTAAVQGDTTISYGELNRLSAALANIIPQHAAPGSKVVAIHAERSVDLIIAILATIRAGYTFAVFDANYPAHRLNTQCEIIAPALMLHCGISREEVQSIYPSIDASRYLHVEREKLSHQAEAPALGAEKNPIAYYLFTSGTTGKPKCIKTSHAPLNHFVAFYEREFAPNASDKFSMLSGVGHDPFLRDLFVPLSIGAEICIPPEQSIRNPYHLYNWVQQSQINYIHGTPQLSKLIEAGKGDKNTLDSLKYFFCGGDILRASHARSIFRIFPNAQLVNFYGATETPQAMGYYRVNRADVDSDQPIPLGKGIDDVELLILTADMNIAATGEKGEVGIRTRFLSNGYLHDEGMTAEKFVHLGVDLPPVYRTGDAGFKNEAGFIVGTGRIDDQVKIRGYRVELAEVNSAVERTGLVENAATYAVENANGEKQLIAFVVPRNEIAHKHAPAKSSLLKNKLAEELPSYMVPSQIFWLNALYLTPNGKIDKVKLLTLSDNSAADDDEFEEITDPVQALIVEKWKTILSSMAINPTYSFVELGGDSLSFIQASLVVEEILGNLPDEWEQFSIIQLATLKSTAAKKPWSLSGFSVVTSVVVRALSIITVVADHFGLFNLPGGVVTLFIVAGWSFGRYSLVNITEKGSPGPIAKLVSRIALPTMLLLVVLRFAFHNVLLTSILLVSNYDRSIPSQSFWFIEILIQIYAVLFILSSIKPIRKLFMLHTFAAAYGAVLLALAAGVLMEFAYNTYNIYHRVPWHYIWGVFLGIAIAESKTRTHKFIVTATLLLCAVSGMRWSYPEVSIFPLLTILAVIWIKSIPLPKPIALAVTKIAMASLFIYITHFLWLGIFHKIHVPRIALIETTLAVVGGIFAWYMWDQLSVQVNKLMLRMKH
jgi:amino acid adenylation domain-containing protein